jgi:hypothetical protein
VLALQLAAVVHAIADGKVASAGGVTVGFAINAGTTNDIIESRRADEVFLTG